MALDFSRISFGAEVEASDWNPSDGLAPGQDLDRRDVTMVNSDGVAVDPKRQIYHLGGELLLAPTDSPAGLAEQLQDHIRRHPRTTVNYRSNLHVHVRVPGLREDLDALKRLQAYVLEWMPRVLPVLEPIPEPTSHSALTEGSPEAYEAYRGARARYARRKISHHKLLSAKTVERQLQATNPDQFLDAEALHEPTGRLLWATCPRACVNLRQLRETDTVEFRHFPGTLDSEQLDAAARWCDYFVRAALQGTGGAADPLETARAVAPSLPKFLSYDHDLERGYLLTSRKYVTPEQAKRNIPEVLRWGLAERRR